MPTRSSRQTWTVPLLWLALLSAGPALAHTAWLEPTGEPNRWQLMFGGHAGKLLPVEPNKLREVIVLDAAGEVLPVRRTPDDAAFYLTVDGAPALLTLHYDNGIYSSTGGGPSVNKPMREVPGATRGVNALKYHKTIVEWTPQITQPLGQPFEVTPLSAEPARVGMPFAFEVRLDGEPLAGAKFGRGEDSGDGVTDAQGRGVFIPEPGFNKLWAGQRLAVDHPDYTQLSYEYVLGFQAP